MKRFRRAINEYANLYRDDRTGIAWVEDGRTGCSYSCHPNIDDSGSVRGMKKLGYWDKDDKTVRSHGYIFNISKIVCDPSVEYERIAAEECACECCIERRMRK